MDAVPIVDLTGALRGDAAAREWTAAAIDDACRRVGFFVVVGHGVDAPLADLYGAARAWFDLPQDVKERAPRSNRYGYVPNRDRAVDRQRESHLTEYMDLGMRGEVPVPEPIAAQVELYQRRMLPVAALLLRMMAERLGAPDDFFAARMQQPQCRLRLLHYVPTPLDADGNLAVPTAPHTDYGALTLLATDGVPGLEVQPIGGDWTPVDAPAGSLVVNIGDMLARWTNDRYRSTPHRVLASTTQHRLSIPFFVNPDADTLVAPIATPATGEPRYEPIRAGDYLAGRIDGTIRPGNGLSVPPSTVVTEIGPTGPPSSKKGELS